MKPLLYLFTFLAASSFAFAEEHPNQEFYHDLDRIRAKYRASKATMIRKADRVIIYLVSFDDIKDKEEDPFTHFDEDNDRIHIAPYNSSTKVLSSKAVDKEARAKLLKALADQIAKPKHTGGAMCHFPIHGIRVYSGDTLLYEGTFCWVCSNFSFSYPEGSSWLDTNAELKKIITELVPIPQAELNRFFKKFPAAKPKPKK